VDQEERNRPLRARELFKNLGFVPSGTCEKISFVCFGLVALDVLKVELSVSGFSLFSSCVEDASNDLC